MKNFLELFRVILEYHLSVSATKVESLLSSLVPLLCGVSNLEITEALDHLSLFYAKGFEFFSCLYPSISNFSLSSLFQYFLSFLLL